MSLNDVRREIAINCAAVREIMLTEFECRVLDYIKRKNNPVRGFEISKRFKCSPQQTSFYLSQLEKKRYLSRRTEVADTGGIEYEYRLSKELQSDVA